MVLRLVEDLGVVRVALLAAAAVTVAHQEALAATAIVLMSKTGHAVQARLQQPARPAKSAVRGQTFAA